ncbi:hypothetical protein OHV96_15680, partial [Acinetobacter baumannii]|nr:hypothetical protein [Acinetobacter baumannii]
MATNWNAVLANTTNFADILAILRKVLGLLDGKVDLTKIDEIIADIESMQTNVDTALADVNTALSEFDAEAQQAIQQVINAGLMEGFATEAELLATRPTVPKKYAKAEDTDVIWFWNKPEGAPDGNYWNSTGLSELDKANQNASNLVNLLAAKIVEMLFSAPGSTNLFQFSDAQGNIAYRIDTDSKHWIVGLQDDLATSILNNINLVDALATEVISKLTSLIDNQLLTVQDAEGNIAYRIDTDSKHWIVGVDTGVATAINRKSEKGLEANDTSTLE